MPYPDLGNDDAVNAIELTPNTTLLGSNVGYTMQAGEPDEPGVTTFLEDVPTKSAWFKFTTPLDYAGGGFLIHTLNTTIDTMLAIYTGTDDTGFTDFSPGDANDDFEGGPHSRILSGAPPGESFYIQLSTKADEEGDYKMTLQDTDVWGPDPWDFDDGPPVEPIEPKALPPSDRKPITQTVVMVRR